MFCTPPAMTTSIVPDIEVRRTAKQRILDQLRANFASLRSESDQYAGYEAWFASDLNNAKLNSVATYYDLVPAFDRLLARHRGDLPEFYAAVEQLTRLSEAERHKQLRQLSDPQADTQREYELPECPPPVSNQMVGPLPSSANPVSRLLQAR